MATQKKKQQETPTPQVEARIDRMVDGDFKTKAYASATIGGAFAVHGIRVIESDKGRFISMPRSPTRKMAKPNTTTPSTPLPPRHGPRWWRRSTTLTSRSSRSSRSRKATLPSRL